ncbi:MAG TPA: redoxin, partial [Chryseobacterium sp.]|nr:redoxin [Chryseobacterium sp.]
GTKLTPEFFPANFKQWDGGSIPFTFMRKGDKTDETVGMMSAEMLNEKLNSFK